MNNYAIIKLLMKRNLIRLENTNGPGLNPLSWLAFHHQDSIAKGRSYPCEGRTRYDNSNPAFFDWPPRHGQILHLSKTGTQSQVIGTVFMVRLILSLYQTVALRNIKKQSLDGPPFLFPTLLCNFGKNNLSSFLLHSKTIRSRFSLPSWMTRSSRNGR